MESKSADDAPPLPEFDVVTCSSVVRLPHDMPIEACTLSADARTFYSATMDGNVCATWVQAGREKRTFGVDGMLSTGVVWASDLLLWLWRRTSDVDVIGDEIVARRFRAFTRLD